MYNNIFTSVVISGFDVGMFADGLRIISKQRYGSGTDKVRSDLFLFAFLDNGKGGVQGDLQLKNK